MTFIATLRPLLLSLGASLMLLAWLAACTMPGVATPTSLPDTPAAPTEVLPPTPTPLPRGGELTIRLATDMPELRPWQPRSRDEEQLAALLYSGLLRLDSQLRPVPDLAERWTTDADGRVLTFTLRSNLTWHDGEPLTAADVLFTLERLRNLPVTTTALLADLRYISAATAPAPDTVVMTLTSRFAPILATMALPILPRHQLLDQDLASFNAWATPVGSGPFQLTSDAPGRTLVLERFERYHHGAPLLEKITFQVLADPAATLDQLSDQRLLLAELPWSPTLTPPAGVRASAYPENGYYFVGFNLREGRPFADLRLRQALALALDIPRLVESATKGQGITFGSTALPGSWADLTPPPNTPVNLETARTLLDEAGWILPDGATIRQRDGTTLTVSLYVRDDDERRLLAARQIAAAAATLGMAIQVETGSFDEVIRARYAPPFAFDLLMGGWINGAGDPNFGDVAFYDPDDFALFHSSQLNQGDADTRATRNVVGYRNPAYDANAEAARQLYNLDQRVAALRQTQAIIAEDLPYLFLWVDQMPVMLNEAITTLDGPIDLSSPRYYWNIERWYLQR